MAQAAVREHVVPGWAAWLGFVALCNAAGLLGSWASGEQRVYAELALPYFAPPGWVFAPVWSTLYVLTGTAAYVVWRDSAGRRRRNAMTAFGVQLVLGALWSPVAFVAQSYVGALVVVTALWITVWVMLSLFTRIERAAGALVIPLLAWVTVVGALNAAIVRLN